jgi:hypothetical protein
MALVLDDSGGSGVVAELIKQVNQLTTDIALLTSQFNAHTHTALNTSIIAGQQSTVKATPVTTKK